MVAFMIRPVFGDVPGLTLPEFEYEYEVWTI